MVAELELIPMARQRTHDMAARGYFPHMTLDGTDVFATMGQHQIQYSLAAEKLGSVDSSPVESPLVIHGHLRIAAPSQRTNWGLRSTRRGWELLPR